MWLSKIVILLICSCFAAAHFNYIQEKLKEASATIYDVGNEPAEDEMKRNENLSRKCYYNVKVFADL
jgi:hypothetical protein